MTGITPGRPAIIERRHPGDSMRKHYDRDDADIKARMNYRTITSDELQTELHYKSRGSMFAEPLPRLLHAEIEEQYVTQYGALGFVVHPAVQEIRAGVERGVPAGQQERCLDPVPPGLFNEPFGPGVGAREEDDVGVDRLDQAEEVASTVGSSPSRRWAWPSTALVAPLARLLRTGSPSSARSITTRPRANAAENCSPPALCRAGGRARPGTTGHGGRRR